MATKNYTQRDNLCVEENIFFFVMFALRIVKIFSKYYRSRIFKCNPIVNFRVIIFFIDIKCLLQIKILRVDIYYLRIDVF